ncbi:MAG: hypothetical protein JKX91_11055 [Rhizobiaceae bacterium]|nr:hypothetical protein [Rhizobiaceae bacterium]
MLRIDFGRLRNTILIGLLGVLVIGANNAPLAFAQSDTPKVPETTSEQLKEEEPKNGSEESDEVEEGFSEDLPNKTEKSITSPPNINKYTPPPILRDLALLPFPARRMHELILEAARTGDVEKLRPYIGYGNNTTMLSLGGIEDDPVNFLKTLSGDSEGHEVLAILIEILESGFVHLDKDTEQELFVWPYFFAQPIDKLTPKQRVELFRIITYGDFEDMESFGAYIFYRVGITPKGRWRFFVAGD